MSTILPRCSSEEPSDKDLMGIPIHTTRFIDSSSDLDLSVDKRTPRIIFKIKKHYVICV